MMLSQLRTSFPNTLYMIHLDDLRQATVCPLDRFAIVILAIAAKEKNLKCLCELPLLLPS